MRIKWLLKKWWVWTIIVLLLVGVFSVMYSRDKDPTYVTQTLERRDLVQTVDVPAELTSIDEVELSFDLSGTIEALLVEEGEDVEIGQVLGRLETNELKADVAAAMQAVQVAQANLDQRRAGSADEAVAISEAALSVSEATLAVQEIVVLNAEQDLARTQALKDAEVASAQAAVYTAQDSLKEVRVGNHEDLSQSYDDLLVALQSAAVEIRSGMSQADEVIGVRNTVSNMDYASTLGAQNQGALSSARTVFEGLEDDRDVVENLVFSLSFDSSGSTILEAVASTQSALLETAELLMFTRRVLDGTLPTSNFTSDDLSALKGAVNTRRDAIQTDLSALLNAEQTVRDEQLDQTHGARASENALAEAELNLQKIQASRDSAVQAAEATLANAQATLVTREASVKQSIASLSETTAAPRDIDLAALQSEVSRARATLSASQARLEKTELFSPISGRVTKITKEIGEQVTMGSVVVTVQTTDDQFFLAADVSESDIAKISIQDVAEVTFDAFGSDHTFLAEVQSIDPAEKLIEGVVYYQVDVYLTGDLHRLALRPGLSADIVVQTENRSGVLAVPQRAVLTRDGQKVVRVLKAGMLEERPVETGLRADGGFLEILRGLNEGEEIVLSIQTNE